MKLLLGIEKGAFRQKYFMMCFSAYLENQSHKQMSLLVKEMSNYTSPSCTLHAQFQILTFCFYRKRSPGKTAMPPD